jgi:Pregnancy-associated plasma protein-A
VRSAGAPGARAASQRRRAPDLARGRALAATAAAISALAASGSAAAYVRYRTPAGAGYYWSSTCTPVTAYLGDFKELSANEVAKSVAAAAHAWSSDAVDCVAASGAVTHPSLEIVPTFSTGSAQAKGGDLRSMVVFKTADWSHDPGALAVTTVTRADDGHILDADIEVNAFSLGGAWGNLDPGTPTRGNGQDTYDLQTVLTHEFGHFVGLDHTCYQGDPTATPPKDDQGNVVPSCDSPSVSPEILASVMYYKSPPNDISKRVLSADEVRAVCDIYPASVDQQVCALDTANDGLGCALGPGPARRPGTLAVTALAIALARRRRGRRGRGV